MPVCDVIAAAKGCGCNGVNGAGMIPWVKGLNMLAGARGAGFVAVEDAIGDVGFTTTGVSADAWREAPETAFPTGTVAILAAPIMADRGAFADAVAVSRFVKRSNGRWVSDPGADISFASLFQLATKASIAEVILPFGTDLPDPAPEKKTAVEPGADEGDGLPDSADEYYYASVPPTDPVRDASQPVQDRARGPGMSPGLKIGLGVGAVALLGGLAWFVFGRKKRR